MAPHQQRGVQRPSRSHPVLPFPHQHRGCIPARLVTNLQSHQLRAIFLIAEQLRGVSLETEAKQGSKVLSVTASKYRVPAHSAVRGSWKSSVLTGLNINLEVMILCFTELFKVSNL